MPGRGLAAAVLGVLVLAFAGGAVAQQPPDPGYEEFAARARLRELRERVEREERILADFARRLQEARAPEAGARQALDRARAARESAERALSARRRPSEDEAALTRRVDRQIRDTEAEVTRFETLLRERPGNEEAQRGLRANRAFLERLRRNRQAILERAGRAPAQQEEALRTAEAVWRSADNAYWEACRAWARASGELEHCQSLVNGTEQQLAEAREALANAEADMVERFRNSPVPHLERVVAAAGGRTVYDASWAPESEALDERIAFMRKAIAAQRREVTTQTGRRDEALAAYVAAADESIAAIQAYEQAIWTQAYKSIGYEVADSLLTIALDAREGGVAGAAVGAGVELATRLYEWGSGSVGERYDLPAGSADPLPPPYHPTTFGLEAGKDVLKDAVKTGLRAFIEGAGAGRRDYRRLVDSEPLIEELWVLMKRRVIFGNRVANETILVVLRRESVVLTVRTAKDRIRGAMAAFKDGLRRGIVDPRVARGIGRSLVQSAVKTWLLEAARSERFQRWYDFLEKDAIALDIYRRMRQESNLLAFEKIQLEAYQDYLQELIAERERLGAARRLRFDVEAAVPAAARAADGSVELALTLHFSREVRDAVVKVNGQPVAGTLAGSRWEGTAGVAAGEAVAQLTVEARDALAQRALDAQPHSIARRLVSREDWADYEPGADNTHTVRLGERRPGVSLVILLDGSGSMSQNDRIGRARAAAAAVLRPEAFGPDDEVALWTFQGESIALAVPFTTDTARVVAAVNAVRPGGATPLTASILRSGDYAHRSARNRTKVLLVLSDGEETVNGDPFEAMRLVRSRGVEVREGR